MMQVAGPIPSAPPASEIVLPPIAPVTVPPHCAGAGTAASVRLAGRVSVKARPVCAGLPFGLVRLKVKVEVLPATTLVGLNALVSATLPAAVTSREALTPLVSRLADTRLMLALVLL